MDKRQKELAIIKYFDRRFYRLTTVPGVCRFRVMKAEIAGRNTCMWIPDEHLLFHCEAIVTAYFEEDISYCIASHIEHILDTYFNYYPRVQVKTVYVGG